MGCLALVGNRPPQPAGRCRSELKQSWSGQPCGRGHDRSWLYCSLTLAVLTVRGADRKPGNDPLFSLRGRYRTEPRR